MIIIIMIIMIIIIIMMMIIIVVIQHGTYQGNFSDHWCCTTYLILRLSDSQCCPLGVLCVNYFRALIGCWWENSGFPLAESVWEIWVLSAADSFALCTVCSPCRLHRRPLSGSKRLVLEKTNVAHLKYTLNPFMHSKTKRNVESCIIAFCL